MSDAEQAQTGTRESLHADRARRAKAPGRRRSASGRHYTETRKNRSDVPSKRLWRGDSPSHRRQTGTSNLPTDRQRAAKKAGWRRSKSGTWYYEARRNRSDRPGFDTPSGQRRAAHHAATQHRHSHPATRARNPERVGRGHARVGRPRPVRQAHRVPSKEFQVAAVNRDLRRRGIDPDTVDTHSLVDSHLSYRENLRNVRRHTGGGHLRDESSHELEERQREFMEQQREAKRSGWSQHHAAQEGGHPRHYQEGVGSRVARRKHDESMREMQGHGREGRSSPQYRVRRR